MFGLGPLEIVVIFVIALLLFGKRLPEIGKGVGKSIVEFKKGLAGIEDDLQTPNQTPSQSAQQPRQIQQNNSSSTAQNITSDSAAASQNRNQDPQ